MTGSEARRGNNVNLDFPRLARQLQVERDFLRSSSSMNRTQDMVPSTLCVRWKRLRSGFNNSSRTTSPCLGAGGTSSAPPPASRCRRCCAKLRASPTSVSAISDANTSPRPRQSSSAAGQNNRCSRGTTSCNRVATTTSM